MKTHPGGSAVQVRTDRIFLLGLLAGVLALAGCRDAGPAKPQESAAQAQQRQVIQERGLSGQITLIEFGLTDCKLSGEGLDEMMFLHREKAISGLNFVRVEGTADKQAFEAYYSQKKPDFPVWHDPDHALAKTFDATMIPCFVLVDKFGRVRYRGKYPEAKLVEYVETLQAETADPGPGVALFGGITSVDVPKLLAETKLPDLSGVSRSLKDCQGAGGLLVVFVDTSCPFAGQAVGEVPVVASKLAAHKVPTILVNLGDAEQAVKKYYQDKAVGAPVLYDATKDTQLTWGVDSVPTVLLVDSAGQVAYRGKAVWADVASAAEKTLGLRAGTLGFSVKGTSFG